MVVVTAAESSATATTTTAATINPKAEDEKKPAEWFLCALWYGPCRRMPYEFAQVRKMYPNIPAERVDMFVGEGLLTKIGRALNFSTCSVVVKTDYTGREVVKRTMLVSGRDVGKLEAATEKLNKQQQ